MHKQFLIKLAVTANLLVLIPAQAGVFMLSDQSANTITHPTGYSGKGGELSVSVGIASPEMAIPTLNAIHTWNNLKPLPGNVIKTSHDVPNDQFDFESVLLHELGHCIGLNHPTLSSESGLSGSDRDYTKTMRGTNNRFDLHPGLDGVIGSDDDQRDDDINLFWFHRESNHPFTHASIVDSTTYSRDLQNLPPGHLFAANASLETAQLLGFGNSEAVMQQGISAGETRRALSMDDSATLRLAMSGFDKTAGTSDDYTLALEFAGVTNNADIVISFNSTGFASCEINATELRPGHFVIRQANVYFNNNVKWFFNTTPNTKPGLTITANNSNNSVSVRQIDQLLIDVSLLPGIHEQSPADYWLRAETPVGEYWLNEQLEFVRSDLPIRAYGGMLISLNRFPVFNIPANGLPLGEYRLTFAVDNNQDGIFDSSFTSGITIDIIP